MQKMLRAILNKSWKQQPMKQQLYGHLAPISKTIQIRRKRYAEYCWRSKEERISDIFACIPLYGRASVGRPARTYSSVRTQDIFWKTDQERWMLGMNGKRESGKICSNSAIIYIYILAWYSPSATHRICLYSLESSAIDLSDLAWSTKFLQPIEYIYLFIWLPSPYVLQIFFVVCQWGFSERFFKQRWYASKNDNQPLILGHSEQCVLLCQQPRERSPFYLGGNGYT